jgi:hypothetical protein
VKAAELSKVAIGEVAQTGFHTKFDLASGTVLSGTGKITALEDGWYRIAMKPNGDGTMGAPSNYCVTALPNSVTAGDNPHTFTWLGNSTDGILVRKPHVEALAGSVVSLPFPTYQRVTTATDYDTVGFPLYLAFDGVDDFLSTGSINFTSTDKMTVVAGVRKLSDAAIGIVVELTTSETNAGSFTLQSPHAAASATHLFGICSTSGRDQYSAASTLGAGTVLAVGFDISNADIAVSVVPRVNGVTPALTTVRSLSTGGVQAFANAVLYIGRRGGTSNPYSGTLYQLIVRGAATADLTPGESFTATKTGITL